MQLKKFTLFLIQGSQPNIKNKKIQPMVKFLNPLLFDYFKVKNKYYHLGLHSSCSIIRLLTKLQLIRVLRIKIVQQLGALLLRGLVVDPLYVGHEDGEVSVDVHSNSGSKAVIVSDVEGPIVVSIILKSYIFRLK